MESEKEQSAVTLGEEDETPPRKKEKSMIRKGKPTKMQVALERRKCDERRPCLSKRV